MENDPFDPADFLPDRGDDGAPERDDDATASRKGCAAALCLAAMLWLATAGGVAWLAS